MPDYDVLKTAIQEERGVRARGAGGATCSEAVIGLAGMTALAPKTVSPKL